MNQPIAVMSYDQESAAKAGGGEYINEGGAHICTILDAKYIDANTGSKGMEFSVQTDDGLKGNFMKVYYMKAPATPGTQGEPIKGGWSLLNAMMGLCQVQQLTAVMGADNAYHCPELTGKRLGLFLQKVLYSKTQGGDGYKFDIAVPFNPIDRKTMREALDNKPAQTIDRMQSTYKDKDERTQGSGHAQSFNSGAPDYGNFEPDFG